MSTIKLRSSDDVVVEIDMEIAKMSGTIKCLLEDCVTDDDEEETIIPLPNINGKCLHLVLEWAKHQKDKTTDAEPTEDISSWEANFMKIDQESLFGLLSAAKYLDLPGLLHITCKTIANLFKGKSPQAIRELFNFPNDLPSEENK